MSEEPIINEAIEFFKKWRDRKSWHVFEFDAVRYGKIVVQSLEEMKTTQNDPNKGWTFCPASGVFWKQEGCAITMRPFAGRDYLTVTLPKPRTWRDVTAGELSDFAGDIYWKYCFEDWGKQVLKKDKNPSNPSNRIGQEWL